MKSVFFFLFLTLYPNLALAELPQVITAEAWLENGEHTRSLYLRGYVEAMKTMLEQQHPQKTLVFKEGMFPTYVEMQKDVFNLVASQPKLRPYSMTIILTGWIEDRADIISLEKAKDTNKK